MFRLIFGFTNSFLLRYDLPESIMGAFLKNNDLKSFDRLRRMKVIPNESKIIIRRSVIQYGTLEQYKYVFGNEIRDIGLDVVPRDRDLYLYLFKNLKDPLYLLRKGYYTLDPYEWIELIIKLKNHKDLNKDTVNSFLENIEYSLPHIIVWAKDDGYTYWSKIVAKSNLT